MILELIAAGLLAIGAGGFAIGALRQPTANDAALAGASSVALAFATVFTLFPEFGAGRLTVLVLIGVALAMSAVLGRKEVPA